MSCWFFASDLHGRLGRYEALFGALVHERPRAVLLGGDLLPHPMSRPHSTRSREDDFLQDYLAPRLETIRATLGSAYPAVFVIFGNDDLRAEEQTMLELDAAGLVRYAHARWSGCDGVPVFGYSHVPPTPFQLKDWERYDVSRYVDPGCLSPEEGRRSVPVDPRDARLRTISADLEHHCAGRDLRPAVLLFHTPPYQTALDRAALDGKQVDHVPLDVHVGSIAVRRLIEARQPRLTLHGHVHESSRLTGTWRERLGRTVMLGAAHDGAELALVRFDPEDPWNAERELIRAEP